MLHKTFPNEYLIQAPLPQHLYPYEKKEITLKALCYT